MKSEHGYGFTLEEFKKLGLRQAQPIVYETFTDGVHRVRVGFFIALYEKPRVKMDSADTPSITIYQELYNNQRPEDISLKDFARITPLIPLEGRVTIEASQLNALIGEK